MDPDRKPKLGARQQWRAAAYGVRTVLRLKPRLFAAGLADELFNRTVPFIEAALAARIITLLPGLTDASQRADALQSILWAFGLIFLVRVVQQTEMSLYALYQGREELDLNALINRRLTEKFARLPYVRYEEKAVMDQYDLARDYSRQLSSFVLYRLRSMAGNVYTLVLAAIAITQFSWLLTAALTIMAVPQLMLEFRINREQRRNWRGNTVTRRKADTFEDLFSPASIKESRLLGLVQYGLVNAYRFGMKSQQEQLNIDRSAEKYRLALRVLDAAVEVGALAFVVRLIYLGSQPIGQFVFAQQVLQRYSGALVDIVWTVQDLDDYLVGASDFQDFMQLPDSPPGVGVFEVGDIVFDNVSFTYPGADKPALRNISLTVPSGSTVAFVGANGAGKTTLVKLLMKLYEPSHGRLAVGGRALHGLDEDAWHGKLGVLFQDFMTFMDFTVRENVRFGRLEQTNDDRAVIRALKQAGAYEFVQSLPKGLDTYLGKYMDEENGTMLSGGQLQRLAIARILYRDPEVLIMDEPTSAIDAQAEYDIFRELDRARRGKTTILISHRFSTVRKADYIFVLHKGRIAEQGTHAELLTAQGRYAGLFEAQAEGYR